MFGALRFAVVLVAGLALLAWAALALVSSTTRDWSSKDLELRALLAVNGTRRAITAAWESGNQAALRGLMADITRDERIMGAAACSAEGHWVVRTADFPAEIACE